MINIKHIIWDWNGTLLNDGWLFTDLINIVLKKRGLKEISLEDYRQKFCFPLEKYYKRLGFNFDIEPYDVPSLEFVSLYDKHKFRASLHTNAISLLTSLNNRGIKNYLLSAQNESSLLEMVNFYKISDVFEKVIGTDNVHARGKKRLGKSLINSIGANNDEVLFVGDTNLDIKMATDVHALIVAATYGHQSKNRFPNQKNILFIKYFDELFDLLVLKS